MRETLTYCGGSDRLHVIFLALPMLFETVFNNLISTVNTTVLSGYSETGVAATGSVGTVLNMLILVFTALSVGASIAISNYLGAKEWETARRLVFVGATLCVGIGAVISVVCFFAAGGIVALLNLTGEVFTLAVAYFKIRVAALTVAALQSVLLAVLRCYGHTRHTVYAGVLQSVVNTGLSVLAVRFPTTTVAVVQNIALAAVVGQICGLLLTLFFCKRLGIRARRVQNARAFWALTAIVLRFGIPAALSGGAYTLSQVVRSALAPLISLAAVSATVYYNNILCYAYIISYSLGSADSIFTGRLCGAGEFDHAERVNRLLVKCTAVANFLFSLILFLSRRVLLGIYTDNPQILAWSTAVFAIDFVAEGARAVSHIYEYSLRGAGDVRFMMVAMILSGWTFGVGGAYLFGIQLQMGVAGFFLATALDEVCRAAVAVRRWRVGKWKTIFATKTA